MSTIQHAAVGVLGRDTAAPWPWPDRTWTVTPPLPDWWTAACIVTVVDGWVTARARCNGCHCWAAGRGKRRTLLLLVLILPDGSTWVGKSKHDHRITIYLQYSTVWYMYNTQSTMCSSHMAALWLVVWPMNVAYSLKRLLSADGSIIIYICLLNKGCKNVEKPRTIPTSLTPVVYLAWSSGSWSTPLSSGTTVRLVSLW